MVLTAMLWPLVACVQQPPVLPYIEPDYAYHRDQHNHQRISEQLHRQRRYQQAPHGAVADTRAEAPAFDPFDF